MKNKLSVNIILMVVPLLWALTFPFIRISVQSISPNSFVFWRFSLAALFLLIFSVKGLKNIQFNIIGWAVLLGILNSATFLFQTIGLKTISSARAAFITGSCVILVPILSYVLRFSKPNAWDWLSSGICLAGLYLVTGASFNSLGIGDLWVCLCALSTALSIILIQKISPKIKHMMTFTFLQIAFTVPCLLIKHDDLLNPVILQQPFVLFSIVFCALFATAIALYIQIHYQQKTTEFKAALIFSTEPLFATIFATVFFNESIGLNILFGGVLVFCSIILSEYLTLVHDKTVIPA